MKRIKKSMSAALSLALAASLLAGCGGQKEDGENRPGGDGAGSAQTDFVYVPEYIPITRSEGFFTDTLQNVTFCDGWIYASGQERYWVRDEDYTEPEVGLFESAEEEEAAATPVTGSDLEPAEGDGPGFWAYRTCFYKIGLDGKCTVIPYDPDTADGTGEADETEGSEETQEEPGDSRDNSGSYVQSIAIGGSGDIYVVENSWHNWNDAPESVEQYSDEYWNYDHYEESYRIRAIDDTGNVKGTVSLDAVKEAYQDDEHYFYINTVTADAKGNLYVSCDQAVFVLGPDGEIRRRLDCEGYVQNLFRMPDGTVAVYTYTWTEDKAVQELVPIDPEAGSFGEGMPVREFYNAAPGGGDYDFYYTSGINFYGYSLATGEREKLLNWLSSDVDPNGIRMAFAMDDGRIVGVSSVYESAGNGTRSRYVSYIDESSVKNELVILTKTPYDQVPHKQSITMATQSLDYNMRSAIIDFNKKNEKYRIDVTDYSEYNTEEDYTAGLTKLRTEILSGTMPDILDLNGLQIGQLAAKGYLEDLYPYIDGDAELSREDLLPNVLSAYETDGKLYRTLSSFTIITALGASDLVGDKPGWTVGEFNAALKQLREANPEATAFDKGITRDDFFQICFYLDLESFVNWSTGETNFDSEGFTDLLEFVSTFPSDFDWDNYQWTEEDDNYYRVSHGLQLLAPMNFYGFDAYELRIYNKLFGGKATPVGFPTDFGVGSVFQSDASGFALSSKCADKDAAWQFLRQFFTEEYQTSGNSWGFPVNKNAFDALMEQAMEPQYVTDANGNFVLDDDGNKIEVEYGTFGWDDYEVPGGPLTQDEADQILSVINSCSKTMIEDETMYEIVSEGAAPFFEGQRSASDVAKQIQSKAMIYVNEQR